MHADIAGQADQIMRYRSFENLAPLRLVRLAGDDVGNVVFPRVTCDFLGRIPTRQRDGITAQLARRGAGSMRYGSGPPLKNASNDVSRR